MSEVATIKYIYWQYIYDNLYMLYILKNIISFKGKTRMKDQIKVNVDFRLLHQQIVESFTVNDLKILCSYLRIDDENLPGDTKDVKAREIIKYCYKSCMISDLLDECKRARPHLSWHNYEKIYGSRNLPDEWFEPLQRLYRLMRGFNKNRKQPFSDERTRQADEIAFSMREAAPFVFDQFDVDRWLDSLSSGKRLAAIKYLEWIQDIDFLTKLLDKLTKERPFIQFHILLAISSMTDQVDRKNQAIVKKYMEEYTIDDKDLSLLSLKEEILSSFDL